MATLAQLTSELAETRAAISKVLTTGQSVGTGKRSNAMPSLTELRAHEASLQKRINALEHPNRKQSFRTARVGVM